MRSFYASFIFKLNYTREVVLRKCVTYKLVKKFSCDIFLIQNSWILSRFTYSLFQSSYCYGTSPFIKKGNKNKLYLSWRFKKEKFSQTLCIAKNFQ